MSEAAPNSNFTSEKETKKFVTPFAFGVHDSILGMRLASPKRRLGAILVDMLCVALLTTLSGFWFSAFVLIVAAYTLFRLKGEDGKAWAKVALRVALIVSVLAIAVQATFHFFISDEQSEAIFSKLESIDIEVGEKNKALEFEYTGGNKDYSLVVSELKAANDDVICPKGLKCDSRFFNALINDVVTKGYDYDDAKDIYKAMRRLLQENDRLDVSVEDSTLSQRLYQNRFEGQHSFDEAKPNNSLVAWFTGFLGDLGLSFGWAALYFSVLTSSWNGQTVGKRVFGIKVVRIDGKTIDLWESFGRYGGYSAGFATGLMGFMQIYWDANRQAIQDKISETLVVKP